MEFGGNDLVQCLIHFYSCCCCRCRCHCCYCMFAFIEPFRVTNLRHRKQIEIFVVILVVLCCSTIPFIAWMNPGRGYNWTFYRLGGGECLFLLLFLLFFSSLCKRFHVCLLVLFHCCDFILPIEWIQYTLIAICSTWIGNTFCFFYACQTLTFVVCTWCAQRAHNEIIYYPHNIGIYCTIWNSLVIKLQQAFLFYIYVWMLLEQKRANKWAESDADHSRHRMEGRVRVIGKKVWAT